MNKRTKKQAKALKVWDFYRNMANSPAFQAYAKENGRDARIPVAGLSMEEIEAKEAELYEVI